MQSLPPIYGLGLPLLAITLNTSSLDPLTD